MFTYLLVYLVVLLSIGLVVKYILFPDYGSNPNFIMMDGQGKWYLTPSEDRAGYDLYHQSWSTPIFIEWDTVINTDFKVLFELCESIEYFKEGGPIWC